MHWRIILHSTIELTELKLDINIGTYGLSDVVPSLHLLDLILSIDPALVLIETDGMAHVFDYDPLITEINRLAHDSCYETQERLITRIMAACVAQPQITAVEIYLRKTPVMKENGALGIRLVVDAEHIAKMR